MKILIALMLIAGPALANENYCRNPVLKQSKELLSKEMSVEKVEVKSVTMGENYQTAVLKAISRQASGRVSELFEAKVDSDCHVLGLEALPDSQQAE